MLGNEPGIVCVSKELRFLVMLGNNQGDYSYCTGIPKTGVNKGREKREEGKTDEKTA